jgi:DnaJ domain
MPSERQADHYRTLGVAPTASAEEVRRAYRRLVRQHHPDHGGESAVFREVAVAWRVLGDADRRAAYDRERASPRPPSPPEGAHDTGSAWASATQWDASRHPEPPTPGTGWRAWDGGWSEVVDEPAPSAWDGAARPDPGYRTWPQPPAWQNPTQAYPHYAEQPPARIPEQRFPPPRRPRSGGFGTVVAVLTVVLVLVGAGVVVGKIASYFGTDDLGVPGSPITNQSCTGQWLLVLGVFHGEQAEPNVARILGQRRYSHYLAGDKSCDNPALSSVSGTYVAYYGPYPSETAAAGDCRNAPENSYVVLLSGGRSQSEACPEPSLPAGLPATAAAGAVQNGVPPSMIGAWSGTVDQPSTAPPQYALAVVIHDGAIGTQIAEATEPTLQCTSQWILTGARQNAIDIRELVVRGPCVDATVRVARTLDGRLVYSFGTDGGGAAVLTRS